MTIDKYIFDINGNHHTAIFSLFVYAKVDLIELIIYTSSSNADMVDGGIYLLL